MRGRSSRSRASRRTPTAEDTNCSCPDTAGPRGGTGGASALVLRAADRRGDRHATRRAAATRHGSGGDAALARALGGRCGGPGPRRAAATMSRRGRASTAACGSRRRRARGGDDADGPALLLGVQLLLGLDAGPISFGNGGAVHRRRPDSRCHGRTIPPAFRVLTCARRADGAYGTGRSATVRRHAAATSARRASAAHPSRRARPGTRPAGLGQPLRRRAGDTAPRWPRRSGASPSNR